MKNKIEQNQDFLEQGYEVPSSGGGYMKLKEGENKFRIMSRPIIGWLDWKDKTPIRFRMKDKPLKPIDPEKKVKHFWAMVVWNYNENCISVLELTQVSILKSIEGLIKDNDWGSPLTYDLKISKSGSGMETEYAVKPVPHSALNETQKDAFKMKPINLDALFDGKDPFAKAEGVANDLPF